MNRLSWHALGSVALLTCSVGLVLLPLGCDASEEGDAGHAPGARPDIAAPSGTGGWQDIPAAGAGGASGGLNGSSGSGGVGATGGVGPTGGVAAGGSASVAGVGAAGTAGAAGVTGGTGTSPSGTGGTAGIASATGGSGMSSGTGGIEPLPAPKFRVFLLIGQSNMSGGAMANAEDLVEDERVRVLGFDDCEPTGRKYNEWDTASPPLHACWTNGIGPGDHFAKALIEALPEGDTIGLIPSAFPGAGIDMFRKDITSTQRGDFFIPPDDHWPGAYDWMIERARIAQDAGGVIEGMIFHQGETDNGQDVWVDKVKDMVDDLRADLGIGPVPFIAGELLYGGCCQGHNDKVHMLPSVIENASYVTTEDLVGIDVFHFDAEGVRIIGRRYGEAMAEALELP